MVAAFLSTIFEFLSSILCFVSFGFLGCSDTSSAPTLTLVGLSPNSFNPIADTVAFALSNGKFNTDPALTSFSINDNVVDAVDLTIEATVITALVPLVDGVNTIDFSAQTTSDEQLSFMDEVWVGSNTLLIQLIDEETSNPFLEESTVSITLSDDLGLTEVQMTSTGESLFENIPDRTILITAAGPNNNLLGSAGVGILANTTVQVTMRGFGTPSPIDNNDFSQGTDGWEIEVEDVTSVSILDTVVLPGPTNPLLSDRRIMIGGFFDESLEDKDLCLFTNGIDDNERTVSRVFKSKVDTNVVHLRYRFVTSEVPGGYFGSQYNDYFRVSIRSQKRGDAESEIASMNGLGLSAFKFSSGETSWRDVWLLVDAAGDTIAVDIAVANVADGLLDSFVCVDFIDEWSCTNEQSQAVFAVGFLDAWEAGVTLAEEAKIATAATGLAGLFQGPADAFRHCFWNCRMAQEIGASQAEEVGTLHEFCAVDAAPTDIDMDLGNNQVGRDKATSTSVDCNMACLNALNNGELTVLKP